MEKNLEKLFIDNLKDINSVTCPICLGLLIEPVFTECKHLFCYICLEELIDLTGNDEEFKCPMCRAIFSKNFEMKIIKNVQDKIKTEFPEEFKKREKIVKDFYSNKENQYKIKILYGNTHTLINNPKKSNSSEEINKHKWSVFVRVENIEITKVISKVIFGLHPTFGVTKVEVTKEPFELQRIGWGTFNIPINIYFNSKLKREPIELNHYLCFNKDIDIKVYIVKIDKNLIK